MSTSQILTIEAQVEAQIEAHMMQTEAKFCILRTKVLEAQHDLMLFGEEWEGELEECKKGWEQLYSLMINAWRTDIPKTFLGKFYATKMHTGYKEVEVLVYAEKKSRKVVPAPDWHTAYVAQEKRDRRREERRHSKRARRA